VQRVAVDERAIALGAGERGARQQPGAAHRPIDEVVAEAVRDTTDGPGSGRLTNSVEATINKRAGFAADAVKNAVDVPAIFDAADRGDRDLIRSVGGG
jgi:hypothetical protein